MSLFSKVATAALIATAFSSFGSHAGAAPLSASLALQDASTPMLQTVQWGGGPYYGSGYGYDYGCCCPPYYGSYSSAYYGSYGSYGSYGLKPRSSTSSPAMSARSRSNPGWTITNFSSSM